MDELLNLLQNRFDTEELVRMVRTHLSRQLAAELPNKSEPLLRVATDLVAAVQRHGEHEQLFTGLLATRPACATELLGMRKRWREQAARDAPDLPCAGGLDRALSEQAEGCRRCGVPFQTFHKLWALLRLAPRYVHGAFDAVLDGSAQKIEAWIYRQIERQTELRERPPAEADAGPDRTLATARMIAAAEGRAEVDARHYFLALLRDEESKTIAELRAKLDKAVTSGFSRLCQEATRLGLDERPAASDVSSLDLAENDP